MKGDKNFTNTKRIIQFINIIDDRFTLLSTVTKFIYQGYNTCVKICVNQYKGTERKLYKPVYSCSHYCITLLTIHKASVLQSNL